MVLFLLSFLQLVFQTVNFCVEIVIFIVHFFVLSLELFVFIDQKLKVVLRHLQFGFSLSKILVFCVDLLQHFSPVFVQRLQS